jgi:hypothetical protein
VPGVGRTVIAPGFLLPTEIRANVRAAGTAGLAGETRIEIGQADVIRPAVAADRSPMAAPEIGAIDQEPASARRPHFPEGDFLVAVLCGLVAG